MPGRLLATALTVVAMVATIGTWIHADQAAPSPQCSISGKGRFDIGWTEKTASASYRCMPTFDADLKPSAAAWVRVEANGTVGAVLPK